jgi:hypothetical protein
VVGSRVVTVQASTIVDGATYSDSKEIEFGPGPLSVFKTAPVVGRQWARYNGTQFGTGDGDFKALDGSNAIDFPAVVGVCAGSIDVSSIRVTNHGSQDYAAAFSLDNGWIVGEYHSDEYYSTTSRLPKISQLVAVSRHDGSDYYSDNNSKYRKGAALAAGWPDDEGGNGNYEYWSGQVLFDTCDGLFAAAGVNLAYGYALWDVLNVTYPGVVGVKP